MRDFVSLETQRNTSFYLYFHEDFMVLKFAFVLTLFDTVPKALIIELEVNCIGNGD